MLEERRRLSGVKGARMLAREWSQQGVREGNWERDVKAIGIGATGATPGGCLTRVLHIIHVSTCNFSFAATLLCWPCCKNAKNKRESCPKKKIESKEGNQKKPGTKNTKKQKKRKKANIQRTKSKNLQDDVCERLYMPLLVC